MLPGFSDTSSWYSTGGVDPGIGGWDEVTSGNAKETGDYCRLRARLLSIPEPLLRQLSGTYGPETILETMLRTGKN